WCFVSLFITIIRNQNVSSNGKERIYGVCFNLHFRRLPRQGISFFPQKSFNEDVRLVQIYDKRRVEKYLFGLDKSALSHPKSFRRSPRQGISFFSQKRNQKTRRLKLLMGDVKVMYRMQAISSYRTSGCALLQTPLVFPQTLACWKAILPRLSRNSAQSLE